MEEAKNHIIQNYLFKDLPEALPEIKKMGEIKIVKMALYKKF